MKPSSMIRIKLDLLHLHAMVNKPSVQALDDAVAAVKMSENNKAAGMIFHTNDKVLLIQRGLDGDHKKKWAFPAGKIDSGESELIAAMREAEEEVGYNRDLYDDEQPKFFSELDGFASFSFQCQEFRPELNDEAISAAWFYFDDLPVPMHPVALQIINEFVENKFDYEINVIDDATETEKGDHWITTESGSRVLLDKDGNIKGGMGGKFTGQNIKDAGGTKEFTKYATNAEREQAKQPTPEAKPSPENKSNNNLQMRDNPAKLSSTSQNETGKSGDKTMNVAHTATTQLKNGMSIKVDGTPEQHGKNSSMEVSIIKKDGSVLISKHNMFVKSANLKDKKEGIYGFVGTQPVGEDTWREIEKAMDKVNSGMPKYRYTEEDVKKANAERDYDRAHNEGGEGYNPHRDIVMPSEAQMRKDDARAMELQDKANAEKFKDTDFFAN